MHKKCNDQVDLEIQLARITAYLNGLQATQRRLDFTTYLSLHYQTEQIMDQLSGLCQTDQICNGCVLGISHLVMKIHHYMEVSVSRKLDDVPVCEKTV